MTVRRLARRLRPWFAVGVIVLLGIQLVPFGRSHPNPPVTERAPWPSEEARLIAGESCMSCHSNETRWPWYSHVAPVSWLIRRDVEAGRHDLNFSTWDRDDGRADDAVESIVEGQMPPLRYVLANPGARLSPEESEVLIDALRAMQR